MTDEDEVRAVAAAFDEVLVGNDAEQVGNHLTDDWAYVGPDGIVPKSDLVDWIASGRLAHHTMTVVGDERLVRVGDTFVYTARKASSGSWDGTPYTTEEWITDLYVRHNGRWRCAFTQKTP
ncbi:nuclear transport factor 2 family protein [Kribbella sp. NPDC050124]|uniref:nuclear transport factor 2 family protein n=1 Tax=Kribbella sp. NPDC050124 TaxID=3364114 RepID=UPI00379ADAEF